MTVNRKRAREFPGATPEVRKDKITTLKKTITEGTYQNKVDEIADKLLQQVLFELVLISNDREHRSRFIQRNL